MAVCDTDPARAGAGRRQDRGPWLQEPSTTCSPAATPDLVVLATPSGLHAVPDHRGRPGGPPRRHREADGDPVAGRQGDGRTPATAPACTSSSSSRTAGTPPSSCSSAPSTSSASAGSTWWRKRLLGAAAGVLRRRAWRGTWEFDGGAFMNQASHYVDLLDWLWGRSRACRRTPPRSRATSRSRTPASPYPLAQRRARHDRGDHADLSQEPRGSITIIGERGTVRVGGVAVNQIEHWEFADSDPDDATVRTRVTRPRRSTASATVYYENVSRRCAARPSRKPRSRGTALTGAADRAPTRGA